MTIFFLCFFYYLMVFEWSFVLFVTLCRKQNIFRSCCLSFSFDGLNMLENTGNRFLGFIFNLFVLLSLDTGWLILLVDDLCLSHVKWLGELNVCVNVDDLREFVGLDVFVVDGANFFSHTKNTPLDSSHTLISKSHYEKTSKT